MLQDGGVYRSMPPGEALDLIARYYPSAERPSYLLDLLGLGAVARTPWRRLSGGERQRLSLALALVGRPEVVFLDEPTAGVDPEGRLVVREVVSRLRQGGVCVLLTTHELEEAERLADQLFVIDKGRLLAAGDLAALARLAGPPDVRWGTRPGLDTGALSALLGVPVREPEPGHYVAAVDGTPAVVAQVAAWLGGLGLPLEGLRTGRASLEEIYLRLTARAGPEAADGAAGAAGPGPGPAEDLTGGSGPRRRGRAR
jgi:ABC-2 type transport system ATP-binding protein